MKNRSLRSNNQRLGILRHSFWALLLPLLQGCFLLGIHREVHNPKRAKPYPDFSNAQKILGDQLSMHRTNFDVYYYRLEINIDPTHKAITGQCALHANLTNSYRDSIQIDLAESLLIDSIWFEGKATSPVAYSRKYGAVLIALPKEFSEARSFIVNTKYHGTPHEAEKPPWKGGFVWKKDKNKNPWVGVACESEGASLWWPCKDVTNDEPDSATVSITVPSGLTAVCNGALTRIVENKISSTWTWHTSYPINHYNLTAYVGDFALISDSILGPVSLKTIPISYYVLKQNEAKARSHFKQAKDHLYFFEKAFGAYPWPKDGYKLIESPYAGMEHQSAIAYGSGYKNHLGGFDYIILHESAHEWWGNSISAADLSDVWLQEGFATYSEALYTEYTQGFQAYLRYLLVQRLFIKNKRPLVGPAGVRYFDYKDSDVYLKGAWVLHTLRGLISNDQIFFGILRKFREDFHGKTCTSNDFINAVNSQTGTDYRWLFDQYLNKREAPVLEYYRHGEEFYYRWTKTSAAFKLPVELVLDGNVPIQIEPNSSVQKKLISTESFKTIRFNDVKALFATRKNKDLVKLFSAPEH